MFAFSAYLIFISANAVSKYDMFFCISKERHPFLPETKLLFNGWFLHLDEGWSDETIDGIRYIYKGCTFVGHIRDLLNEDDQSVTGVYTIFRVHGKHLTVKFDTPRCQQIRLKDDMITNLQSDGEILHPTKTFEIGGRVRDQKYWSFDPYPSETIHVEQAVKRISDAVTENIVSVYENYCQDIVPIVHNSGGRDTGMIVAIFKKLGLPMHYYDTRGPIPDDHPTIVSPDPNLVPEGTDMRDTLFYAEPQIVFVGFQSAFTHNEDRWLLKSYLQRNIMDDIKEDDYLYDYMMNCPRYTEYDHHHVPTFSAYRFASMKRIHKFESNHVGHTLYVPPMKDIRVFNAIASLSLDDQYHNTYTRMIEGGVVRLNDEETYRTMNKYKTFDRIGPASKN